MEPFMAPLFTRPGHRVTQDIDTATETREEFQVPLQGRCHSPLDTSVDAQTLGFNFWTELAQHCNP